MTLLLGILIGLIAPYLLVAAAFVARSCIVLALGITTRT